MEFWQVLFYNDRHTRGAVFQANMESHFMCSESIRQILQSPAPSSHVEKPNAISDRSERLCLWARIQERDWFLYWILQYKTSSSYTEKSDTMSSGGRLPKVTVLISCVHDTWGFRFQKFFGLSFKFKLFAFSCLVFSGDMKMTKNPSISRLLVIKRPYQICQSHANCSDWVGSFIVKWKSHQKEVWIDFLCF